MQLKVLGSGSDGNCYILESDTECLILDAGIPIKSVKVALDFNITKISGVLVTHTHQDHFKYAKEFANIGVPISRPFDDGKINLKRDSKFKVQSFALTDKENHFVHTNGDESECPCYGFYIKHPDLGILVYATDCTFIKYHFKNVNHFLIESNYSMETLDDDGSAKVGHTLIGHQSIETACDFIKSNDSDCLQNVILCHLSKTNGNKELFKAQMEQVTSANVYVADTNLIIDL